ncbi:MAG: cupin domain-containing protein [Mycolicibacterium sp.]|uniref:cupin domain-containing protein n=1 Tax=Mycolicibacterium sp. TaxID=2320850 RepID=UPI000F9D892E|nr:cupin domain-containing protein [Mycolicibacterium sp.]RUP35033.1 MAG: cupin domain-containing protein [Mycolicibacterium sp.]
MTKLRIGNACAALGLAMLSAPVAAATPPEGDVVRTDLARGDTAVPVEIVTGGAPSTLIVQGLKLAPGASSGWHTHPGTEYSAINTGGVVLQTADNCAGTEFGSGQAVFIPAGVPHRVANDGAGAAEVVVTYTVPVDVPLRVDAPDACAG